MNEEEKKIIEKFVEKCNKFDESVEIKGVSVGEEYRILETVCKALDLLEKLQKENEELKIKLSLKQFDINVVYNDYLEKLNEYKENSITVQKVKDKIEEILNNKEYRIVFEGNAEFPDDATIINAQKYIKLEKMQELIEEREEK